MKGFGAFLRKELVEIARTWRIWVLPGIVLFFALSGPPLAMLTPEILKSVGASAPGVVIEIPPPTWLDAYAQWVKNLSQIVTFALVIIYGGLVSGERKTGTAILVLTKPLTRNAYVAAKVLSAAFLVVITTVVGALLTWAVTLATFGEAPVGVLVEVTALWLASALVLLAVMALLSTLVTSQAGAAGIGFGVLMLSTVLGMFRGLAAVTPIGLASAPGAALMGEAYPVAGPLVSGAVVAVACVAAAMWEFSRQEL